MRALKVVHAPSFLNPQADPGRSGIIFCRGGVSIYGFVNWARGSGYSVGGVGGGGGVWGEGVCVRWFHAPGFLNALVASFLQGGGGGVMSTRTCNIG